MLVINQKMMMAVIVLYFTLVAMVTAAPLKIRDALPPSEDPFYTPPSGFENQSNGAILRSRSLSPKSLAALSAFPQNLKAVYQLLYRTTDALGNATATVTTLMVPYNADSSKLVSYQTAEDAPYDHCAPSYSFQKGTSLGGILPQLEILLMDTLLSRGYYVNTADYEGPKSMFAVGAMAGHAVLDSVRAVLASGNLTELKPDAQVQLWGYSGGSLATGWAVQLQSSYAPELKIIGAALGGTVVDLNATMNAVAHGSPFAGLAASGIIGLSRQYADLATYLDQILLPAKKQAFYDSANMCAAGLVLKYAFQDINTYVSRQNYLSDPIPTRVMNDNMMGLLGAPKIPLFMYHSVNDEIVPFTPAYNMYNSWCSSGGKDISIQFVKDILSEHGTLAITGAANAINFLIDRFGNKPAPSGCQLRTTITSALDPGALPVFGKLIWDDLTALLGKSIGPDNLF